MNLFGKLVNDICFLRGTIPVPAAYVYSRPERR